MLIHTKLTMSNFELFNQVLTKYEKKKESKNSSDVKGDAGVCSHDNIALDKGVDVCTDCGEEIIKKIQHTKEWRYYGQSDTRHSSDPNRVQIRKSEERSIYKDVENMGFSDKIVSEANKIYFQVTKGQIFRGNSRKAIVFACIFHSYKLSDKPQSHDKLIHIFSLTRKTGLKGLKHVNLHAPKNSSIRTTYITPINLVEEIMEKFSATDDQKKEVIDLYHKIKNKSSRLNRSRPQSVASGLVYYWICKKKKDITLKQFTKKVSLSELTVNKIAKEISEVIEKQNCNMVF
jgi:transcription initiation factor TFIIIB Brf1 subunit/transcription initiation factor TFIIB